MKLLDIQFLNKCINFETRIDGKVCSFLWLYRTPSQTRDIFKIFAGNFISIQKQLTGTKNDINSY